MSTTASVAKRTKTRVKIQAKTAMLYVCFALCLLGCGNTFDGAFSFGLFVGAIYSGNPFVAAILYLLSGALWGLESFLWCATRAGVTLMFVIFHKLIKRKIRKWALVLHLVAANIFYCAYQTDGYFRLFDKILFSVCGVAFAFVCIYVFRAVFVRGLSFRPALDEILCIGIFTVTVSFCVSQISLWGMDFVYFVIPAALLFCSAVIGDSCTLTCGVLLGLGNLLATGLYDCCAFCVFCAVAIMAVSRLNRYIAALSVVLVDVLMSYFFHLHEAFSTIVFLPTLCSVVVFMAVPSSVFNYLRDCVCGSGERYLGKSVVKKLGSYTARKLYRLSDIFLSMKNAFLSMSGESVSTENAHKAIVKQCSETVCKDCPERVRCWRKDIVQTEESLLKISTCAVKRGKCTILDVPQNLSLKCVRVSTLLAEINGCSHRFREYADRVEQANCGKALLAEQLGGVSQLLTRVATDCKGKVSYSTAKEKELVERLVFHNVMCCGAVVMEQTGAVTVIVTVGKKDLDEGTITQVVSKLLNQEMVVEKVENTESPSWANVILSVKPHFNVVFGISSATKENSDASGDTHSITQTDNGKCIVALCDGMGSGSQAEKMSETAIGLVENFYRAGFDSDTVLSCVNRLLTGSGNEVFCAVDICVIDLSNGLVDFVKLGAPIGLVKCAGTVEIVNGSSLPLGVLEEMTPSVTQKALCAGDMILLMSDGVTDAFGDPDVPANIFADNTCTNPQSVAEIVLERAVKASGGRKDDMTVLAVKIA